ncbi:hypothetical protein [uncultured Endozoicomonas sp.]|uniref:hypothetical protein n=1 Tax=uncultured Endozoicomonas sp. TaxID=432652 RepID=UPI00262028A4|nr:hypothetical protein [uncultured Endozoicomonas sp.]
MTLNASYLKLLLQNWSQTCRTAKRLAISVNRLAERLPLSIDDLQNTDEELFEKLDAFRVRFGDLQDSLGAKVFRSLLLSEDEEPINMADTLNRMEKRQIIQSAEHWRTLREIRNAFAHDYPEAEAERVNAINLAWKVAPELLDIADNIYHYCQRQNINLPEIERADKQ